ncbi:MAG: AAA family ATPase, partial [Bacteroidales bacterium]|nr:AAA family ATPase [Bacteroidales bacterium]
MKYTSTTAHEELAGKRKALENARTQLRKEFIGIDKPIDDIIGSFGYWYYFPEIQTRPVIINLWGLTGVGKTSLINRLMELLGMQKKFFRFNLSDNEWDIRSTLADIYDNRQDNDFVILLDEFQHVRTIREDQTEKSTRHQFIWDLLDSGRIPVNNFQMRLGELSDLVHRLNRLLQLGVVVSNGNVVSGEEIYRRELGEINTYTGIRRRSGKQPNNDLCFVPKYFHEIIFETDREKFSLMSEVTELLNRMTGTETIAFLRKMVRHGLAARHLDCSRSLVFIIGNLDEAYAMAGNFDTEIDADEFHAESLKITLPVVKEALRRRFRSEQISRLGNNHIIYPALDSNAYKKIIENELDSLSRQFYNATGVWLLFDSSIHRLIYAEGVFPTQGTRPLLSTINNIVTSQFPRILFKIINSAPETESVVMYRRREKLLFKFMKDDRIIAGISEKAPLALENLRECTNDDMQAVTAVHESGHAIASLALLKTVPE